VQHSLLPPHSQATHGKKIAVIENEFGEVGIDDALLSKNTKMQADEEIIEMMNGCICCTVRQVSAPRV
jgi:G3E family GTPase